MSSPLALTTLTSYINTAAFPLAGLLELSSSGGATTDSVVDKITREIETILLIIFIIATVSYFVINIYGDYSDVAQSSRYIDWLLTTPLLGYTYYLLGVKYGNYKGSAVPFFLLPLFMIVFGYLSIYNNYFYLLSFIFLILFLYYVRDVQLSIDCNDKIDACTKRRLTIVAYFFYIGWTLYGLAFLIKNIDQKIIAYNVLDFINKIIFSVLIISILRNN